MHLHKSMQEDLPALLDLKAPLESRRVAGSQCLLVRWVYARSCHPDASAQYTHVLSGQGTQPYISHIAPPPPSLLSVSSLVATRRCAETQRHVSSYRRPRLLPCRFLTHLSLVPKPASQPVSQSVGQLGHCVICVGRLTSIG